MHEKAVLVRSGKIRERYFGAADSPQLRGKIKLRHNSFLFCF